MTPPSIPNGFAESQSNPSSSPRRLGITLTVAPESTSAVASTGKRLPTKQIGSRGFKSEAPGTRMYGKRSVFFDLIVFLRQHFHHARTQFRIQHCAEQFDCRNSRVSGI